MAIEKHYYRFARVSGSAINLSGIANDLCTWLPDIEEELEEHDEELATEVEQLLFAIKDAWKVKRSTAYVNTHPYIKASVQRLSNWAFETEHLRRVPSHPIMRLMIDAMRSLAGVPMPDDPLYLDRWGEADDICKERGYN